MNIEFEIKLILASQATPEEKAKRIIQQLVSWSEKELIEAIKKNGTATSKERGQIILHFWSEENLMRRGLLKLKIGVKKRAIQKNNS